MAAEDPSPIDLNSSLASEPKVAPRTPDLTPDIQDLASPPLEEENNASFQKGDEIVQAGRGYLGGKIEETVGDPKSPEGYIVIDRHGRKNFISSVSATTKEAYQAARTAAQPQEEPAVAEPGSPPVQIGIRGVPLPESVRVAREKEQTLRGVLQSGIDQPDIKTPAYEPPEPSQPPTSWDKASVEMNARNEAQREAQRKAAEATMRSVLQSRIGEPAIKTRAYEPPPRTEPLTPWSSVDISKYGYPIQERQTQQTNQADNLTPLEQAFIERDTAIKVQAGISEDNARQDALQRVQRYRDTATNPQAVEDMLRGVFPDLTAASPEEQTSDQEPAAATQATSPEPLRPSRVSEEFTRVGELVSIPFMRGIVPGVTTGEVTPDGKVKVMTRDGKTMEVDQSRVILGMDDRVDYPLLQKEVNNLKERINNPPPSKERRSLGQWATEHIPRLQRRKSKQEQETILQPFEVEQNNLADLTPLEQAYMERDIQEKVNNGWTLQNAQAEMQSFIGGWLAISGGDTDYVDDIIRKAEPDLGLQYPAEPMTDLTPLERTFLETRVQHYIQSSSGRTNQDEARVMAEADVRLERKNAQKEGITPDELITKDWGIQEPAPETPAGVPAQESPKEDLSSDTLVSPAEFQSLMANLPEDDEPAPEASSARPAEVAPAPEMSPEEAAAEAFAAEIAQDFKQRATEAGRGNAFTDEQFTQMARDYVESGGETEPQF